MTYFDNLTAEEVQEKMDVDVSMKYNCYYYMNIRIEPYTPRLAGRMVRRMMKVLYMVNVVEFSGVDLNGNHTFEIQAEAPIQQEGKKRLVNAMISIIDEVVKDGKFLHIRIYRSSEEYGQEKEMVFSNIASDGMWINKEEMMVVAGDMFNEKLALLTIEIM